MNIKNIIGVNLKKIRLKNRLSRYALGLQIQKTPSCIANIESGLRCPSLSLLFTLAAFFQVDIRTFLTTQDPGDSVSDPVPVTDWQAMWPQVGNHISHIRKSQKIRQYDLAHTLGITVAFLCNIEKGNCFCSLPLLASLADALGVDICDLFVLQ